MVTVAVVGNGMLGYANAAYLSARADAVVLYGRNPELAAGIERSREHPAHFPGLRLPGNVKSVSGLENIARAEVVFLDVNSEGLASACSAIAPYVSQGTVLVSDVKGIGRNPRLPLSVIRRAIRRDSRVVARGGWMLAQNLAYPERGAVYASLASRDTQAVNQVAELTSGPHMFLERTKDERGVQLAGILKNAYCIGTGIFRGLAHRNPERSSELEEQGQALFRVALSEGFYLGTALGGKPDTFNAASFAWGKDFYLSSHRPSSINRRLGELVGYGVPPAQALEVIVRERSRKPEGWTAVSGVYAMAQRRRIDAPLIRALHQCLFEGKGTGPVLELAHADALR